MLTPDLQQQLCQQIRLCYFVAPAARRLSVNENTVYGWLDKGSKSDRGKYRELWKSVKKAQGDFELRALAMIQDGKEKQWQRWAWLLERAFPERWSLREPGDEAGDQKRIVLRATPGKKGGRQA